MGAADLFEESIKKSRRFVNPPYSIKDTYALIGTLIVLLAVPLTVISVKQVRDLRSRASETETPAITDNTPVEYVSNEILIKIKNSSKSKIKSSPTPTNTGIASLDKLNKSLKATKVKAVLRPTNKSKNTGHEVFRWYKITLPGEREIITDGKNLDDQHGLDVAPTQNVSSAKESKISKSKKIKNALAKYKADPNVESVSLNHVIHTLETIPNDPYYTSRGSWGQSYDDLWGLKKIGTSLAWDKGTGSSNVVVAVVDTGVDRSHPDIKGNTWVNAQEIPGNGQDDDGNGFIDDVYGWDFVYSDNNPLDENRHGTHVAGTIAAVGNNGIGVVGVSWSAKIMSVRFLDASGSGFEDAGALAIEYAADNGARVINNSWGGLGSQIVDDAISYAHARGVTVVSAAGNSADDALYYSPARSQDTITVSASDVNDMLAGFSNRGQKIDVAAPGVDILSTRGSIGSMCASKTVGTVYCRASGTSMAAPHVSGLAVLLLAKNPSLTNEQIRQIIRTTATDIAPAGRDSSFGYGRIGANNALQKASGTPVAYISGPTMGQTIYGTVLVRGQAWGPNFASYKLEIGEAPNNNITQPPSVWRFVCSRSSPVTNGTLCDMPTANLNDAKHVLRLTVTDIAQKNYIFEAHDISIDNVVALISSPTARPYNQNLFTITGSAYVHSGTFSNYKLEWSSVVTPSTWNTITTSVAPVTNGTLGNWDTSSLPTGEYNLRMTVTGTTQESVTIKLAIDKELVTGWPRVFTNSYNGEEVATGDVVGDGRLEIVFSVGNVLHVADINGNELPGFPKTFDEDVVSDANLGPIFKGLSTVDLNNDGKEEIIFADSVVWSNIKSRLNVWVVKGDGSLMPGWPFTVPGDPNFFSSVPAIADVDNNGRKEIFIQVQDKTTNTQKVYGLADDGSILPGWPQVVAGRIIYLGTSGIPTHSILLVDIAGDNKKEIVASNVATSKVFAWNVGGSLLSGWPVDTSVDLPSPPSVCGEYNVRGLAAVDTINDGKREILVEQDEKNTASCLHSLTHNHRQFLFGGGGEMLSGWPKITSQGGSGGIGFSIVDADLNGKDDIIYKSKDKVYVWDATGNSLSGWPISSDASVEPVAVANINADNNLEFLLSNWSNNTGSLQGIQIFSSSGTAIWERGRGFGIDNYLLLRRSVAADIDGDGKIEIVSIKPWYARERVEVYVWRINSSSVTKFDRFWTTISGNTSRTGEFRDTLPPSVNIIRPKNGDSVASGTVLIEASATDNLGVAKVIFYVDGKILAIDSNSPYTVPWNTRNLRHASSHTIKAEARDFAGNISNPSQITVKVIDTIPPTVSITDPANGAYVTGNTTVIIRASASDNDRVSRVEFLVNNKLTCTVGIAPYACAWGIPFGPGILYSLTARAYDFAGRTAVRTISVTSR